ncbi:TonB-dependent receptor [Sphingopyxis granuli]|uniref:TonB-dependent receptor n=1 Tax=Sphingopyxis granuli TaxID=267128 RepID=UPI00301BB047
MKYKFLAAMLSASTAAIVIQVPAAQAQALPAQHSYNIAAQDLGTALQRYSQISGREVIASSTLVQGKRSSRVRGRLSADAALSRLLSGTGLFVELIDGVLVVREGNGPSVEAGSTDAPAFEEGADAIVVTGSRIRGAGPTGSPVVTLDREAIEKSGFGSVQQLLQSLPQAFGGGSNEATTGTTTRNGTGNDATLGSSINLRGLGTSSTLVLIDGARPALGGVGGLFADISLIPVSAIERVEVLTDGASAIYGADAVAGVVNIRLRSRFDGAETMFRAGTADGDMTELQFSQLLGKRWSGGHVVLAYQFSERGALAGSERDFAREDLRPFGGPDYRSTTAVPGTIRAANGQIFGVPTGQNGTALTAAQLLPGVQNRRDARAESDVLPRQRVHSLYAGGEIELTEGLTLRANVLAAERRFKRIAKGDFLRVSRVPVTNPSYVDPIGTRQPVQVTYSFVNDLGPDTRTGRVRAVTLSGGLEQRLGPWRVELSGAFGRQKGKAHYYNLVNSARLAAALADTNPATALNVFGDGTANNPATLAKIRGSYGTIDDFSTWSAALRADGPLFRLPGGDMRLAVGAEYRREAYDYFVMNDISTATPNNAPYPGFPGPRHVKSIYAELNLPVVGEENSMPGIHRLEFSAAGRIEDYNQFGRTENPKFSARWEPVPGIAVRGSFGTSFRAPLFDELIGPALSLYSVERVPDPASPTGTSPVLALFGYAPNIQPEKATTWTAGVDIAPPSIPGLRASLTYYDVDYRDRIGTVTEDYLRFLSNRDVFGGVIVDNPPLSLVQYYFNQPTLSNPLGLAPTDIKIILDGQTRNLSAERQRGIDFDVGYAGPLAGGTFDVGIGGTHIFSIMRQLTPGAASTDFVGLYASPVKWRLRGRAGWSKGGFSANAFVNHTDSYLNQIPVPAERVDSWTTVDLTLSQRIGGDEEGSTGRGLQLGLSILNLFDKDPPYAAVRSQTSGQGYDPEKASPIGRMISVQATIRW